MSRPRTIEDPHLLDKAMHLFWRKGFESTGIRELEQTLGLKAPSLYHRFGSKEALFAAALTHYVEHIVQWRIHHYLEIDPPLVGLRTFFDTCYDYIDEQHPPLACLLVNTSLELYDGDPSIRATLTASSSRLRLALRDCLQRAQTRGELAVWANIDDWVSTFYLALQGLLVNSKTDPDLGSLRAQVDALFRLLPQTNP